MQPPHIYDFLQRFANDVHTEEEHWQFLDWLRSASLEEVQGIADQYQSLIEKKGLRETSGHRLVAGIETALDGVDRNLKRLDHKRKKSLPPYRKTWVRAAAAILVIASAAGLYFALTQRGQFPAVVKNETKVPAVDVLPGSDKAVLVKSDGTEVVLQDYDNQKITERNGLEITNKNGLLSYVESPAKKDAVSPAYNTVRVPRKGQYKLAMSDGTKVWLNAESSLTYPTVFTGDERKVEVTGEAYFEVAKHPGKPFHVMHKNLDVLVLGTHFEVNGYEDEKEAKVTLLEGSVKVASSLAPAIGVQLKPGQQARLHKGGQLTVLADPDMEEVMAWKDGRFQFKDADLKSIMRQLTRWYDIEVNYQGNMEERYFTADISRNKNLSTVLKILELSNIHCTIEGKILIVKP